MGLAVFYNCGAFASIRYTGSACDRRDEQIFSFTLKQDEGDPASLSVWKRTLFAERLAPNLFHRGVTTRINFSTLTCDVEFHIHSGLAHRLGLAVFYNCGAFASMAVVA
jgi:hypothetical protein